MAAAPSTARSPWSCFKRLRISSAPLRHLHHHQSAFIATSRRRPQDDSPDRTNADAQDAPAKPAPPAAKPKKTAASQARPPQLPTTEKTERDEAYNFRRPQMIMRDYLFDMAKTRGIDVPADLYPLDDKTAQMPRGVQALHKAPLRRKPTHGIPTCNLQLRSFTARNLETMTDFALRAAYYLGLPAKGPVPLPRITERWTVPRSVFVHKKAQENWERITMRRLVQIVDGHPDVVRLWLAFIRKWMWYGVGMRADVWENEGIDDWKKMDSEEARRMAKDTTRPELFGRREDLSGLEAVEEYMNSMGFGGAVPSSSASAGAPPPPKPAREAPSQQA